MLLPYQEREPGAAARALGLLNQILQGLSRGNIGLILLQSNAVAGPGLLPLIPAICTPKLASNIMSTGTKGKEPYPPH